jgi:hypothetical protein
MPDGTCPIGHDLAPFELVGAHGQGDGVTSGPGAAAVGDVWQAFAAGPEAWHDSTHPPTELDGVARLVQRVALLLAATWPVVILAAGGGTWDARTAALIVALVLAVAGLIVVVPSALVRQASGGRPKLYLEVRLPLAGVVLAAWSGLSVDAALLGLWPLGVAAGCDVCRTGWALGVDVEPWYWLRRLLLSPVHLGVAVTLVVFAIAAGADTAGRLAWLYGALAAITLTGAVTARALDDRQRSATAGRTARDEAVVLREHRSRGHWLHDDVCADLRLLRLRLEGATFERTQVLAELDELDHRLRLRQLDELVGSGEVRLAEVVQPFLRRAQQLRVLIVESPTVEDAGVVVDAGTARAVQHAVSVLVANALQAGSPTLAVRLSASAGRIEIEVEDEAGGFDLDRAPVGRGLDGLRHELGRNGLTCTRTELGSVMRAVVVRGAGRAGTPARRTRHRAETNDGRRDGPVEHRPGQIRRDDREETG